MPSLVPMPSDLRMLCLYIFSRPCFTALHAVYGRAFIFLYDSNALTESHYALNLFKRELNGGAESNARTMHV